MRISLVARHNPVGLVVLPELILNGLWRLASPGSSSDLTSISRKSRLGQFVGTAVNHLESSKPQAFLKQLSTIVSLFR
ncbi:hypothetical protein A0H81_07449 [Grifola frondosa]|uniref:Uncharacterized protein n=1 Tax=Grifola frondosa TaxID=5627 RepID=A0A1C7M5Q0_GRIFR|nr:hypothetical protein A0H81_07449 [Grifola frondosa]